MRILHVTESRSWSGGTVQLWRLSEALLRKGHAVALFCPPNAEILKHAERTAVVVTTCPMRQDYDLPAALALSRTIKAFRPEIVHAHHPRAHSLALIAARFSPPFQLVVSRRVSFKLKKWNLFSQWKYRTNRIRMYTAVSKDIKDVLVAGGVDPGKVEVIHSGVDTGMFSPRPADEKLRRKLNLPSDVPIAGNLTHFSWWKGQTFFLEAARKLLDAGARAHFLLVGKDTDGPEASKKVHDLGIEKSVTLAGFRTDIPEVLSLLRCSVVSSLAGEGFSGVIRESMSMGVPVVATDVGGNRELVEDGKTGLIVPPGDASALAGAISRMLTDKPLAVACSQAAQRMVRERFSLQTMVIQTEKLYERLVRK